MNEETIFHRARELPIGERAAYLDEACGTDLDLRQRLEMLLQAYDNPNSLLQSRAPGLSPTVIQAERAASPGTVIGPYKLLEQIGEGGFGIVYMADQQAPVRRRVALKIIKPGMDTKQVLARFRAELHALSLMDHPNIARALDAGATDAGRPYFVMELVRGIPITDYCDQNSLPVRQRLDLFVTVCHAVQHAHQKGIIHRDIKPSNVLVTINDGRPVPKVIDFGVAKAINQQLTPETIFTRFAEMIGTPLYMSPEQAEMTSLDIDTRSDIYSLGVLLYELLTGTTPFEKERMKQAAFDEIRRIIREEEPAKPSTRISTLGANSASVAAHRHAEPGRLGQLMRGDLDWIVMKALEKDRTRRYETANAMAMDLQRHLADEPVSAGPPSAAYRFRKFARRNRAALAMAAIVTAALLLGIVGTTWQAIVATTERDRAQTAEGLAETRLQAESRARAAEVEQRREAETQHARAEANFQKARAAVDEYFTLVSDSKLLDVPGLQPLRKELLEAALRYYETFLNQRTSDARVRTELAAIWLRVSQVYHQNNLVDDAVRTLNHGLEIVEVLVNERPGIAEFPAQLAGLRKDGRILTFWGLWPHDTPEAIRVHQKAAAIWETFARDNPKVVGFQSDLAWYYRHVGDLQIHAKQPAEALASFQRSCDLWEVLVRDFPAQPEYRAGLAESLEYIAVALRDTGRHEERETVSLRAIELREKLVAEFSGVPDYRAGLANSFRRYGAVVDMAGRPVESEQAYRRAVELWEKLTIEFPGIPGYQKQLANAHLHLGALLRKLKRPEEAEKSVRHAFEIHLELVAETPGERDDNLVELKESLRRLQELLTEAGSTPGAADDYRQCIARFAQIMTNSPNDRKTREMLNGCYQLLGNAYAAIGQREEARKAFRDGAAQMAKLAAEFPDVPYYRAAVGHHQRLLAFTMSDTAEAQEKEQALREAVSIFQNLAITCPQEEKYRHWLAHSHQCLGQLYAANRRFDESASAYRQCCESYEKLISDFPNNSDSKMALAHVCNEFGTTLKAAGRHAESEISYRKALDLKAKLVAGAPTNADYRFHLAHTHLGLAHLMNETNRPAEAEEHFRQAYDLFAKIAAEIPSSLQYRVEAGHVLRVLGRVQSALGRHEDAERNCSQGLAVFAELVAESPQNREYRWQLAGSHEALGSALSGAGRKADAETEHRDALALWEKLVAEDPRNHDYRWHLAACHDELGHVVKQIGRLDEALALYERAFALWEKLAADSGSADHRLHLTWTRNCLVELLLARTRQIHNEARRAEPAGSLDAKSQHDVLANCETISAHLVAGSALDDAWTQVACLRLLAGDAKGYQDLCRQISQRLDENKSPFAAFIASRTCAMSSESPITGSQAVTWAEQYVTAEKNAWSLHELGLAHYRAGQFNEAVQRCEQSISEFPNWGHMLNWLALAMAHERLGHRDQAAEWLNKATQWRSEIPKDEQPNLPPQDWLEFQVLYLEANAQLKAKTP